MFLTIASVFLSLAWLIWVWAYTAHRRPVPAAWTRSSVASGAVVLIIVGLLPVGLGCLAAALLHPFDMLAAQSITTGLLTAGSPVLAVLATPRLRRGLRADAQHLVEEGST